MLLVILNVSQSVISRMWSCHLTHGDPSWSQDGFSSPFLLIQYRRQRFQNATSFNTEFRNGNGVRNSTQTVRNNLHEFGLNARIPAIRVPLTRQHVQDRFDFARNHVRLTVRDWTPVLFTDESRFCLDFTDRRLLVRRMPKDRFDELIVAEHECYGKGKSWLRQALAPTEKN